MEIRPVVATDFEPLARLLSELEGATVTRERLEASAQSMPGGASPRRYFRVPFAGKTAVAMFVPEPRMPDEIHKKPGAAGRRWPFLEVGELLRTRGVTVPATLGDATTDGWLLLEDLGDDTLANYLAAHPEEKTALYVEAVKGLARAQRGLSSLPDGSIVAGRAFDEELLHWEIQHFREWGLEARGIALDPESTAQFDRLASALARRIAALPRTFVHRDYQSRNLMVRSGAAENGAGKTLAWIDFQDALLGPRVYDLVALLNDSYQVFEREFVEARLRDFALEAGIPESSLGDLVFEFDLVTVQRKLKDAGRFVFIDRTKQNPSFLKFVEPTIEKAKSSIERLQHDADVRELGELLARAGV